MKYQTVSPEHTIGAEVGNRYAVRARRPGSARRAAATPTEPSRKPRDAAELLAKIDAIYQELTIQPPPKTRRFQPVPAENYAKPTGLIFIGGLIVALTLGEIWLYFDRHSIPKRLAPSEQAVVTTEIEASRAPPAPSVLPPPATIERMAVAPKPETRAETRDDLTKARAVAQRQAARKHKANQEAARRAWEAEEKARLARAEEIRRADAQPRTVTPTAAPRGPASPEEACADRANFFSRNTCEARACQQPEWANHPSCVRRKEEQQRNQFPFSGGG